MKMHGTKRGIPWRASYSLATERWAVEVQRTADTAEAEQLRESLLVILNDKSSQEAYAMFGPADGPCFAADMAHLLEATLTDDDGDPWPPDGVVF